LCLHVHNEVSVALARQLFAQALNPKKTQFDFHDEASAALTGQQPCTPQP
jgi:hypothetical protein